MVCKQPFIPVSPLLWKVSVLPLRDRFGPGFEPIVGEGPLSRPSRYLLLGGATTDVLRVSPFSRVQPSVDRDGVKGLHKEEVRIVGLFLVSKSVGQGRDDD